MSVWCLTSCSHSFLRFLTVIHRPAPLRYRVSRHPGERGRHGAEGILRGPGRAAHPAQADGRPDRRGVRPGARPASHSTARATQENAAVQLGRTQVSRQTSRQVR